MKYRFTHVEVKKGSRKPETVVSEIESWRRTVFFKAIAEGKAIKFAQKPLLGARQHPLQPAARQKRAVAAILAKTVDESLILVEGAHDVANANVARVPGQANAALRASNALDISGGRELLQHFRHMVARHVEMISDRGRAQHLPLPIRQKDQRA